MKIAQITSLQESVPPLNKNGLEQVVSYLTEELVRMGHEVTLFATADSKTSAKLVSLWPKAVSRDSLGNIRSPETYVKWVASAVLQKASQFDVIHDHTRFVLPYFANLIKTPIVSTVHHPVSFELNFLKQYPQEYQGYFQNGWQKVCKDVTTVMVSSFQKKEYPGECQVVYNGLDLSSWKYNESGGDYFAFLGYMTPDKGAAQAIEAILPTKNKLLIAGPIRDDDPTSKEYFESKIKPYLNDRIQYIGGLNYSQKIDFLGKAKATLLPIQWDEPFGMVAIESMASGTPVIALNRAAMPEIITNAVDGFLIESVEELTTTLEKVNSLSRANCRKKVETNFSISRMANDYLKVYENRNLLHE